MDERTEQAVDKTILGELFRNGRIVEHPTLGAVRLFRPNPEEEWAIAECRRKQYQKDLFNDDIKSKDEILRKAIERGMWSEELTDRLTELNLKLGEFMGMLDAIGFKSLPEVIQEYNDVVQRLRSELFKADFSEAARAALQEAFDRYLTVDSEMQLADRNTILNAATSTVVDDLLTEAETLRTQITLLNNLFKVKQEINKLQERQTRLFVDSIESRADRAEELARLYYCTAKGETNERLWPSPDAVWKEDPEILTFLLTEMGYFLYGVTQEFRDSLERYGFTKRLIATPEESDDSPGQPTFSSGGESRDNEQMSFFEDTESIATSSTLSS